MHAASALLTAGIFAVSAYSSLDVFHYEQHQPFRRNEEPCRVCYGDDCTVLSQARCEYYVEVETIVDRKDDGEGEETEVDEMVYDLVEHAAQSWTTHECLPLISEYTDCTKDNICLGCKKCQCSSRGRWSCKEVQRCRPQVELDVDYEVLESTINALENYEKSSIQKRSIRAETNKTKATSKTSLVEITEWMYGVLPNIDRTQFHNQTGISDTVSTKSTPNLISTPEPDYIDFNEVLRTANEGKQYRRRKPQLKDNNRTIDVNIDIDDIQIKLHNESEQFLDFLNAIEEGNGEVTEPIVSDATFVVDLLAYNNGNDKNEINNDTDDIINILNKDFKNTIDNEDSIGNNALNIKKRDISSVINTTSTTEAITTTAMENDLNNTVLIPLSNIINDKQNELNELLQIKENLLNYMNINNGSDVSNTMDRVIINGSNTYFSIYKLDLHPEIATSLRMNNPSTLDKLLLKLKRDIYEVRRDIGAIQNFSETSDLPIDLKILLNAMKKYIQRNRQRNYLNNQENYLKLYKNRNKISRRNYEIDDRTSAVTIIKNQFINILEVLKKNMPQTNVMLVISRDAKKIIKRIINHHYVEESPTLRIRLSEIEYNITDDLNSIGNSWLKLTLNMENSPPSEMIYALKLLHLTLSRDINKINDAMALINFARSRRMILIENLDDTVMNKINKGLDSIRSKVETLIRYRNRATRVFSNNKNIYTSKIKKKSFIQKLRNLLRSSKKDIVDMTNKHIPKSEIVRTIAKRKLDEIAQSRISEDEKTMLRWQSQLNVLRKKRYVGLNYGQIPRIFGFKRNVRVQKK